MNDGVRQLREIATGRECWHVSAQPEPARTGLTSYHVGGEYLRAIIGQELGVKDWWAPEKAGSVGKLKDNSNMNAGAFPRKYKGQRFFNGSKQLWHTWDRPKEEVLFSTLPSRGAF